jgi:hypothetical protein
MKFDIIICNNFREKLKNSSWFLNNLNATVRMFVVAGMFNDWLNTYTRDAVCGTWCDEGKE